MIGAEFATLMVNGDAHTKIGAAPTPPAARSYKKAATPPWPEQVPLWCWEKL